MNLRKLIKEEIQKLKEDWTDRIGAMNSNTYRWVKYSDFMRNYEKGMSKQELFNRVLPIARRDRYFTSDSEDAVSELQADVNKFFEDLNMIDSSIDRLKSAKSTLDSIIKTIESGQRSVSVKSVYTIEKLLSTIQTVERSLKRVK